MATGLNMLRRVLRVLESHELSPEDEKYDNEESVQIGEGTCWNRCIAAIRKDVQHLIDLEEKDTKEKGLTP